MFEVVNIMIGAPRAPGGISTSAPIALYERPERPSSGPYSSPAYAPDDGDAPDLQRAPDDGAQPTEFKQITAHIAPAHDDYPSSFLLG
jgi:hypothetical protein